MRNMMLASLVLGLGVAANAQEPTADEATAEGVVADVAKTARLYVPAKAILRKAPDYPRVPLSKGREAWIHVAYCIDESGQPQNISVLDASGSAQFERAAVKSVKGWRFEPAQVDGEPSWQSRNQSYITFAIEEEQRGASGPFVVRYKRLRKLIQDDELEKADELFNRMLTSDKLNLYELGRLWEQRVRYELKTGDMLKLDLALHRATASGGEWIEPETYQYLLAMRVKVHAQLGHYSGAISDYEKLAKSAGEDSDLVQELSPLIEQVVAAVESGSMLQISGEVREKGGCFGCDDSYRFTPEHRTLALHEIDGTLDSIEMRCDHRHFESEISDLVEWRIPEKWGKCSIQIRGEPGTTFKVLMFPDA